MKSYSVRNMVLMVAIVALALGAFGIVEVTAQGPEMIVVTNPSEGETVSGIVNVTGAVDFPDFLKYDVFLQTGDNMLYVATVYSPVINGVLAFLDTRTVPDGTYQLVIRAVNSDSNYTDHPGPTFTIDNGLGAPLPHPEVNPAPLYAPFGGALARIRNCSGFNLEFDYTSPDGFCSSGNLWIMPKTQDMELCSTVDVLLIPCEYRGTAFSEDGESGAVTYSFIAEHGKIYDIVYPGGEQLFINEIPGDERAETDTGGLDPDDPARMQSMEDIMAAASSGSEEMAAEAEAPATMEQMDPAEESPAASAESQDTVLPVSGAAATSTAPFAIAATGLIVFMVIGGVVAIRKGKQEAE